MNFVLVINLYEESNLSISILLKKPVTDRSILSIVLYAISILSVYVIFFDAFGQDNGINSSTTNIERFSHLGINDSFSLSGSIISTIKATTTNVENTSTNSFDNSSEIQDSSLESFEKSDQFNYPGVSNQAAQLDAENLSDLESPISNFRPSERINQTDSFSNNLVSMLSGIIIQSIEKGNPTITDTSLNNNSLQMNNPLMVVSGNWRINVDHSNVTNFDARLIMITASGSGFHWHILNNFHDSSKSYFGNDGNIFLNGSVDFYTDNNEIAKKININVFINNLEVIQIILDDKNVSNHFYGYPIYGTIDKVEIPN